MGTRERPRALMPDSFAVPLELVAEDFRLEPVGPRRNAGDYEAWTSSIDHVRATPGFQDTSGTAPGFGAGVWPDPGMTLEDNLADLRRHAEDFAQRSGLGQAVPELPAGADAELGEHLAQVVLRGPGADE